MRIIYQIQKYVKNKILAASCLTLLCAPAAWGINIELEEALTLIGGTASYAFIEVWGTINVTGGGICSEASKSKILLETDINQFHPITVAYHNNGNRDICIRINELQSSVGPQSRYTNILYDDPDCHIQIKFNPMSTHPDLLARATPQCHYTGNCSGDEIPYNENGRADQNTENFQKNCLPLSPP